MALKSPTSLVKRQTEAVSSHFDAQKEKIMMQIGSQVEAQIKEVKSKEKAQLAQIESKISQLEGVVAKLPDGHPQKQELQKQLGMLKQQRKHLIAQVKFAIASIKANAAREKENIKTRLEREKQKAIVMAVNQALAQYSMMVAAQRAKQQQAANDELKAGNRG